MLWTFLVAAGLAFIFMVTCNASAISNGVLALMGLSSGTTLLAAVSDGPGTLSPLNASSPTSSQTGQDHPCIGIKWSFLP